MIEDLKHIAEALESRISGAQDAIGAAALDGNWEKAQTITAAAKQLEEASRKVTEFKKEIHKAVAEYDDATRVHIKAAHTRLRIRILWPLSAIIEEPNAGDSLARFIATVVSFEGEEILKRIAQIQVGTSSLISENPDKDFRNPNTDKVYSYRKIEGTTWFVKIHSSTSQKVDQIERIKDYIKNPRDAVRVEIVEK